MSQFYNEIRAFEIKKTNDSSALTLKSMSISYNPKNTKFSTKQVDRFMELENLAFPKGMSDADRMKMNEEGNPGEYIFNNENVLLTDKDGTIIGFIIYLKKDNLILIEDFVIHPEYRKGGLGKILMGIILRIADLLQLPIELESPSFNLDFYSSWLGFETVRSGPAVWKVPSSFDGRMSDGKECLIPKILMRRNPRTLKV